VDFAACGVAKMVELPPVSTLARRVGLTAYSAPEYRLGKEPNERSDQFSVAAIAYEILTGKQPYAGQLEKLNSKVDFSRLCIALTALVSCSIKSTLTLISASGLAFSQSSKVRPSTYSIK